MHSFGGISKKKIGASSSSSRSTSSLLSMIRSIGQESLVNPGCPRTPGRTPIENPSVVEAANVDALGLRSLQAKLGSLPAIENADSDNEVSDSEWI